MKLTDLCPQCSQPWSDHRNWGETSNRGPLSKACHRARPALLRIVSPSWTLAQAQFVGAVLTHAIEDIADAGTTGDELREALAELERAAR